MIKPSLPIKIQLSRRAKLHLLLLGITLLSSGMAVTLPDIVPHRYPGWVGDAMPEIISFWLISPLLLVYLGLSVPPGWKGRIYLLWLILLLSLANLALSIKIVCS